jgi:transcriptional regulator with XRE-family HTH domain
MAPGPVAGFRYVDSRASHAGYPGAMDNETSELGARLRAIRSERGHSLATVADAAGISASFLSLVETGKNDITFGRLRRLMGFYDITMEQLLPPSEEPFLVRAGDHRHLRSGSEGIDAFVLAPGDDGERLYALLVVYEPASEVQEPAPQFESTVLIHVIEGTLLLHLADSGEVALGAGDSAHFNGAWKRRIHTGTESGARFLYVTSPPPPDRI